ncbi:MAG: hypothetical protein EKK34_16335 [Mycobacterium sp.]|nr:MAG: hypothetical protein EKK34_16335 [Mycobacterium sp.]
MTTDNTDFMARYLPPEGPDRANPAGPAPQPGEPSMPAPVAPPQAQMETARPPQVAPPPSGPSFAPPASERTPPPPAPPQPTGAGAAGVGHLPGSGNRPEPAPPLPAGHQHEVAAAAQRWAPQADPHAAAYGHRQIQVGEVVKQRRRPPEMGWRKAVYAATMHQVNLGAGPAERTLRDQTARITTNIPGVYQISAISIKGGVGKTTLVAAVGSTLRKFRNEPVIAIDANPTYGGLGRLVSDGTKAPSSIREFLGHGDLTSYSIARQFFGHNEEGLEVLAGNQNVAHPLPLTPETFADTIARTQGFYQLSLVDCGAEIDHPVIPSVLSASNALMIVGSMNIEGGLAVEKTLDWLAARNGHELLKRSVIVLNDAYRCANKKFITHVTQTLGPRVAAVKVIPFDAHLRDAQPLDFGGLRPRTRAALIDLAAELADGFPTAGALHG